MRVSEARAQELMDQIEAVASEQGWDETQSELAFTHALGMEAVKRMMLAVGFVVGLVVGILVGVLV